MKKIDSPFSRPRMRLDPSLVSFFDFVFQLDNNCNWRMGLFTPFLFLKALF